MSRDLRMTHTHTTCARTAHTHTHTTTHTQICLSSKSSFYLCTHHWTSTQCSSPVFDQPPSFSWQPFLQQSQCIQSAPTYPAILLPSHLASIFLRYLSLHTLSTHPSIIHIPLPPLFLQLLPLQKSLSLPTLYSLHNSSSYAVFSASQEQAAGVGCRPLLLSVAAPQLP